MITTDVLFVTLTLALKTVAVAADGQIYQLRTCKSTVGEVISQLKINVYPGDIVKPSLNKKIENGDSVQVIRVTHVKAVQTKKFKELDYNIEDQNGVWLEGKKRLTYLKIFYNGVEVACNLIKSEVIEKPKNMDLVKRSELSVASRGMDRPTPKQIVVEATAYSHTGNPTASGLMPYQGVIAVDPKVIPLGSHVYVEQYGNAVALDTGGAIKGNRIDVFFPTNEQARKWGRRKSIVQFRE